MSMAVYCPNASAAKQVCQSHAGSMEKSAWPNPTHRGSQAQNLRHGEKRGEQSGDMKVDWTHEVQVQSLQAQKLKVQSLDVGMRALVGLKIRRQATNPDRVFGREDRIEIEMRTRKLHLEYALGRKVAEGSGLGREPGAVRNHRAFQGGFVMTRMGYVPVSRPGANEDAYSSVVARALLSSGSTHSIALRGRLAPSPLTTATTGIRGTAPPNIG